MKVILNSTKILILIVFFSCAIGETKSKMQSDKRCNIKGNIPLDFDFQYFIPFEKTYEDFNKNKFQIDILKRNVGQKSHISRLFLNDEGVFIFNHFTKKGQVKEIKIMENQLSNIDFGKFNTNNNYYYDCNKYSSDLGTNLYIIKNGNSKLNFYFENGTHRNLTKAQKSTHQNVINLLDLIYDLERQLN